jgi:hypothetical protein
VGAHGDDDGADRDDGENRGSVRCRVGGDAWSSLGVRFAGNVIDGRSRCVVDADRWWWVAVVVERGDDQTTGTTAESSGWRAATGDVGGQLG